MSASNTKKGFREDFLGEGPNLIPLESIINTELYNPATLIEDPQNMILNYNNYSVIMDKDRRFPILTASNIQGKIFKKADRSGSWKKDKRIEKIHQWGSKLYKAEHSEFDKGHMTKREDVQWGDHSDQAIEAAESTFYYTNAVPQHLRLNRAVWSSIETYILKAETVKNRLKVAVLTGPVLDQDDPEFVTLVDGEKVQLPVLFWKIVYYLKGAQELYRTAFLVSQEKLLEENRIVKRTGKVRSQEEIADKPYFLQFKKAATYQVNVGFIEKLTGLNFVPAIEEYKDERPEKLIEKEIVVRSESTGEAEVEIKVENLIF